MLIVFKVIICTRPQYDVQLKRRFFILAIVKEL